MSAPRRNLGTEVEAWLKDFSRTSGILSRQDIPLEKVVRELDNLLQRRMADGRLFIANELPFAQDWIDRILSGKVLPAGSSEEAKAELKRKLLDYVLATDVIVSLRSNAGREYQIAIDVTCDPSKETEKLNRIQGRREDGDPGGFNRNTNLPTVRKALGIDKHLILIVKHDNLPSNEVLLNELYQFANTNARTRLINLYDVERVAETAPVEEPATPSPDPSVPSINFSDLVRTIDLLVQTAGQSTPTGGYLLELPDDWRFEKEEDTILISHYNQAILIDDKYLREVKASPEELSLLLGLQAAVKADLPNSKVREQDDVLEL